MKQDIAKLFEKFSTVIVFMKRHNVTLFLVLFLGTYTLLVVQINRYMNADPSQAQISEQIKKTGKLSIDQESIDRILELEERNIEVKTLFIQARDNPFNE